MEYKLIVPASTKIKPKTSTLVYTFSKHFLRKYTALVFFFFIIGYYVIYEKRSINKLKSETNEIFQRSLAFKKLSTSNEQPTADEWQYIGEPKERYQMYSAYFDSRLEIVEGAEKFPNHLPYGSVRIIAILPLHTSYKHVHCNFRYTNLKTENEMKIASLRADAIHENFHLNFSAFSIVCPLTTDIRDRMVYLPETVGITIDNVESMRNVTSFVRIKYPQNVLLEEAEKNIAVCVAPAHHNFSNALRIVEFVEIYRSLGVEKFYFYNETISENVGKVFNYYKDIGVASVMQWNFEGYTFEKEVRYEGIFAALNDCVYRATFLDNFKYTIIVDFDEIIVPFTAPTLTKFLEVNDRNDIHSFNFRSAFFYFVYRAEFSTVPNNTANDFLYSQVQITRQEDILPRHKRSKYIVKGQNAIEMGNHFIWKGLEGKKEFEVTVEDGLLFHYREDCLEIDPCGEQQQVIDDRARVFDPFIWNSVDYACAKIFADGICPMQFDF